MKIIGPAVAIAAVLVSGAAWAEPQNDAPEVLQRDDQGRATKVKVDGYVMDVCTPEKTDGCINPRDAGLDEGNREIKYWPGRPASEIDKPLPVERPAGDEGGGTSD